MAETAAKEVSDSDNAGAEAPAPPPGPSLPGVRGASGAVAIPSPAVASGPAPVSASARNSLPGLPPPPAASGRRASLPPRPGDVMDEDQERWLIQKEDKMDYGPFSLRDVRAQIEQGKVHADHNILDNETGDRRRVADHPLIGQMAREWTAKHAELERQLKDQKERAKHRDAVVKLLSGIFAVLIVIGAGVGIYAKFIYKPPEKVIVKKEVSNEDFFKGIQISMKVDPPPPKKPHTGKKKGPKNGAFDDTQNMNFDEAGDVLPQEDINRVMQQKFGVLSGCLREEAQRNPGLKKFDLDWLIKGNGSVTSVKVNGSTSSPVASCIFAKMQSITFPECKTCSKTHASMSFSLR
jgi:hypothetical protein